MKQVHAVSGMRFTRRRARAQAVVIVMARALVKESVVVDTFEEAIRALDALMPGSGERARLVGVLVSQGKPARVAMDKHPPADGETWTDALAKLVDAYVRLKKARRPA